MTALVNHFAYEFKSGLRNHTSLLMNYLFPLMFYVLMGLVMSQVNPLFPKTIIPVMIIFGAMSSALLGLPGPLIDSREFGIYRSFKINGVPAFTILAIPTLTTIFHVLIIAVIITLTAPVFFNGAPPINWLSFVLVSLLTVFTCGAIGALIGVVSSDARMSVLLSQLIFLLSMLLGGLMMPLSLLPESAQRFAVFLPPAHAMQAFLGLAYNQETVFNPTVSVGVMLISTLIAFGLAIYLFNWDSRNNARRGHPLMGLLAVLPYLAAVFIR